jgi:hypothetical protein
MERVSLMYALEGLEESGMDLLAVYIITCLLYFTGVLVWYMLFHRRPEGRRVRWESVDKGGGDVGRRG